MQLDGLFLSSEQIGNFFSNFLSEKKDFILFTKIQADFFKLSYKQRAHLFRTLEQVTPKIKKGNIVIK
jgi:hypothetical protein